MELQRLLNAKPSKFPPLVADGAFGAKTQARVIEFQRDNGLKPDGLVGDLTMAKLKSGGLPGPQIDLNALINELAAKLDPFPRSAFILQARSLVASPGVVANVAVVPIIVIAFFIVMLFMMMMALQSRNPANRAMGREWNKRIDRLKESIRGKPVEVQTAEAFEENQRMGRDMVRRAQEERDKCVSRLDPAKLAKCASVIKKLSEAIQSAIQTIGTPLGPRGVNADSVLKGIGRTVQALIQAAREMGECTGCDGLFM